MNQNKNSLTIIDMPPIPTWMDSIQRFEKAAIARSWAGNGRPEELPEITREYADARNELLGQFVTLQGHSIQAGDLADVLAEIESDPDSDIVVQSRCRTGWSIIAINHAKTELLNDHLEDILGTHGRPFGQS
jgi:hypothetical protein